MSADLSDIPVLTKVVQKNSATVALDMSEILAQVKQSLLPEIHQLVTDRFAQLGSLNVETQKQALDEHAQSIQQSLVSLAQSQIGDSIQTIEQAFREAMGHVGQQHIQTLETQVASLIDHQELAWNEQQKLFKGQMDELLLQQQQKLEEHFSAFQSNCSEYIDAQKALMTPAVQSFQETIQASMDIYVQSLEEDTRQRVSNVQKEAEAGFLLEYKQSMEKAFLDIVNTQTDVFKARLHEELPVFERVLQDKVSTMVEAHMADVEVQLNAKLKSKILEVLQGIKFVMPSV